ncbi:TonB-dependent receptor [Penaeicola halotolerans]|uniref:TonB-dependent receptor n=1 Tax=Penaeicola halotolerans TaxID=2793196 RepID=UPI001CF8F293|nr:TonB-dependent receptor [Penaeicola halotolerans]
MKLNKLLLIFCTLITLKVNAQTNGVLQGTILDKNTKEPLIGVSVALIGTDPLIGGITDISGKYRIEAPTGSYNVRASFIGYKSEQRFNIILSSGNAYIVNFELEEEASNLDEVVVTVGRAASAATIQNPISINRLSTEEIKSNPGGNFDISRVIQTLPGVGGSAGTGGAFRNDIIIRGGAPNENVFYLDGIEIPVINHFQTQGGSGGPAGILNVSFIEDVTLNSSGFNAKYDNALASVFEFKQREGNQERFQGNVRLSATELATTFEGPAGKKTNYLVSARRSYLQLLFQAIDLPIRPNYWDFQYKVSHQLNDKLTLTALGVGAIDEFRFGVPRESSPDKAYVLRATPSNNQWNYTVGFSLRKRLANGYSLLSVSRNVFDNRVDRFEDQESGENNQRNLGIQSQEVENKLRWEVNKSQGSWKYSYGLMAQYIDFSNEVFNVVRKELRDENDQVVQPAVVFDYNAQIDYLRYGAFGQVSRSFFNNRLGFNAGIRTDMNSFTDTGMNPLRTLSPRMSLSYVLTDKLNLNGSVGQYYKTPINTVLSFQDESGNFVNKNNEYIGSLHYVLGLEYLPRESTRFTVEGFYKKYTNYPVSIRDGISLANLGGDFSVVGNEPVASTGDGRAYGFEFLFQQKLIENIFAVFSYTYVRSEFSGLDGEFISSSWDNRNLISALFGKKFPKGWELGLKYRYAGGSPLTPFDLEASRLNFLSLGTGVLDFDRLNSERLGGFSQLDVRIDKKWNFPKYSLNIFLDVQNALITVNPSAPRYSFQRNADNTAFLTTDGQAIRPDGSNGIPILLIDDDAIPTPSIGIIFEF